jgi:hypothetical protein
MVWFEIRLFVKTIDYFGVFDVAGLDVPFS